LKRRRVRFYHSDTLTVVPFAAREQIDGAVIFYRPRTPNAPGQPRTDVPGPDSGHTELDARTPKPTGYVRTDRIDGPVAGRVRFRRNLTAVARAPNGNTAP